MPYHRPLRKTLALALSLAATSCARRETRTEPPSSETEQTEPVAAATAEVVEPPASDGEPTRDAQMLAFFDALGDLMVRDLLAWAATDFQTQSEAKAEFDAVLDKTGAYSSARMQAAAKRAGIAPQEIVEFVGSHGADYVRLAEASSFGPKVKGALDGPEVAAQLERIESLPQARPGPATSGASPERLCKTMQSLAVAAGEQADEGGIRECVEMMSEMQRVDPMAYDKMSACIMGSPTMAAAVDCIEKIQPSGP